MELVRSIVVNDWELKVTFLEPEKTVTSAKTGDTLIVPGAGNYKIDTFHFASEKIAPGDSLSLTAKLSGENIAYLYTEIFFKDKELDYYYGPLTHEFIRSENEKENNGVVHPAWGAEISLALEIKPVIRVLTDGMYAAFAFTHPAGYNDTGYQLEGLFTKKGSGNSNRARLKFDNSGEMTDKRVILEKRGRLVSHDLSIKMGDLFIPAVHVLTAMNLANPKSHSLHGLSDTLTKAEESFHWVDEAAIPGEYLLGLVVEDFNGDQYHHYLPFSVETK